MSHACQCHQQCARVGPLVLPWSEKLVFAANWVARRALHLRVREYIPDFKRAFDHFCLHAGAHRCAVLCCAWFSGAVPCCAAICCGAVLCGSALLFGLRRCLFTAL
jgi:hypothetical protein